MMRNAVCLLLLGYLLVPAALAQTDSEPASPTGVSEEAEAQLLAAIFPDSCHFSGQFSQQKAVKGLPMPLKSRGDFYFSCELGLIWHTQAPFQEALLYANASDSYRVNERGDIEPLSGVAKYAMSNIFLRVLKGDTDYFAQMFTVRRAENESGTELLPDSAFMQKGIKRILISKQRDDNDAVTLNIHIDDTTGQRTAVTINQITPYAINDKQAAYDQCRALYPSTRKWCRALRMPGQVIR
ncbi:outer membrane lipoprotein carrier protein LolA [Alteromonas halophila]|nr:outer membrane lipoprotein carrier protein LolA [Alteromonas halophila]